MTSAARADVRKTYAWYRKNEPHLLKNFQTQLKRLRKHLGRNPEAGLEVDDEFRKARVLRTPYIVYYSFDDGVVLMEAVFRGARDPDSFPEILDRRS